MQLQSDAESLAAADVALAMQLVHAEAVVPPDTVIAVINTE